MSQRVEYIGIDIACKHLDVQFPEESRPARLPYDDKGLKSLTKRLPEGAHVVFESTAGYEVRLADHLAGLGITYSQLNPRCVRDFARASGRLAKTDEIDAGVITRFAQALRPRPTVHSSEHLRILRRLVDRRDQLVAMRTAERNRKHRSKHQQHDVSSNERMLKHIEEELERIEAEIEAELAQHEEHHAVVERLKSTPGISTATAVVLLTHLPELGTLDRRAIAKLVGVAPLNNDSGTRRGKQTTWGGRRRVRSALYMSVLVGIRYNPVIKDFYQRLVARGKPKKVAMTAAMRKLLVRLNAMIRDQATWSGAPAQQLS